MHSIGNIFLTKREVSKHEAIKRALSVPRRHPDKDVWYVLIGIQKNKTRVFIKTKVFINFRKMHPDDEMEFAYNTNCKFENGPDNLDLMCLTDFECRYDIKKAVDLPIKPDETKSYTVLVSNIDDVKLNPNIIVLKNELVEIQKRSLPCVYLFPESVQTKYPTRSLPATFTVIYALKK